MIDPDSVFIPIGVHLKTYNEWYVIAFFIAAYALLILYYRKRMLQASRTILLAPITVKGKIPEQVGARETGLILRAQLFLIQEIFQKVKVGPRTFYTATAVGESFRNIQVAITAAPVKIDLDDVELPEETVVKVGTFQVPVGAMLNLVKKLVNVVPVPYYKKRYYESLIHVSLIDVDKKTQLLVHHGGQHFLQGRKTTKQNINDSIVKKPTVLTNKVEVANLDDYNSLLREAAFMILKLYGRAFPRRGGESMMHFVNGLEALDCHRRTGDPEFMNKAEKNFFKASAIDDNHAEALYFYGSMLLDKRTRNSIESADLAFKRAQKILENEIKDHSEKIERLHRTSEISKEGTAKQDKQKLLALIYAGRANCCAQGIHRLAKCGGEATQTASKFAEDAKKTWEEAMPTDKKLHPWIHRTLAIVEHVNEAPGDDKLARKKRFLSAAKLYLEGLEVEPDNAPLFNNLGWIFLKLAEWEEPEIEKEEGIPDELVGIPAKTAERFLKQALDLNPYNKLTHANLCLLYATPYFREHPDKNEYLRRCRYYGQRALKIDPRYINGHRDLALSLARYKKFNEAYEYYEKALKWADVVEKDLEIIDNAIKVLKEIGAGKKEIKRWENPDPKLLEPPEDESPPEQKSGSEEQK